VVLGRISWTDHVRNEEALQTVKGERNIVQTVKEKEVNWIGQVLRRNCHVRDVTTGKKKGKRK